MNYEKQNAPFFFWFLVVAASLRVRDINVKQNVIMLTNSGMGKKTPKYLFKVFLYSRFQVKTKNSQQFKRMITDSTRGPLEYILRIISSITFPK